MGNFYYDLYLKSNNVVVDGKRQIWTTGAGPAAYQDISYTLPGSPTVYNTEVDGSATVTDNYSASIAVSPTSIGKLNIDYTSSSGTPADLEYWYALRGPGLPSSLQRQGSKSDGGAYTREFFLHSDRQYSFNANIANNNGGAIKFAWSYYDGAAWVAFPDGEDALFIGRPPTSGRVKVVFADSGSNASSWSLKALPR